MPIANTAPASGWLSGAGFGIQACVHSFKNDFQTPITPRSKFFQAAALSFENIAQAEEVGVESHPSNRLLNEQVLLLALVSAWSGWADKKFSLASDPKRLHHQNVVADVKSLRI